MENYLEQKCAWETTLRVEASPRRRRVGFAVINGEVIAHVPAGFSALRLRQLIVANRELISELVAREAGRPPALPPPTLAHGSELPFLGEMRRLQHDPALRRQAVYGDGIFRVAPEEPEVMRRRLEELYRQLARENLTGKVAALAGRHDISVASVGITGAETRWGSCTARGSLNFSWRLILTPEPMVDYVVAHELAHRREMNHSAAFWREVGRLCPNFRVWRKLLQQEGEKLRNWSL